MKEIPLSKGLFAIVDDEDYAGLMKVKWYVMAGKCYAGRHIKRAGKQTTEYMHRRILQAQLGEEIDHVNHNGLDNRRGNIRVCTRSQNHGNTKKFRGSSNFKGVHWNKDRHSWHAQIRYKGKQIFLGRFTDGESAARAYDEAARQYFGEFAELNFRN